MAIALPVRNRPTVSVPSWLEAQPAGQPTARRTRIVCTLGPASEDDQTLHGLVAAGMDVARFNFSHGSHDFHRVLARRARAIAADHGRPVATMQDLQGPKLRIGTLPHGPMGLVEGDLVELRPGSTCTGDSKLWIPVPHRSLVAALQPGDRVLFGDGEIELSVRGRDSQAVSAVVVHGGELHDHKGITVPGRPFHARILTRKDLADLAFGQMLRFDYLALSFVRTGEDVEGVRRYCRGLGWRVPLVAKLETQEALWNLDGILRASDAVMVARGDLGVQLPLAEVPAAQKEIISGANRAGVPVITATQMLESMISAGRPTRAEVSDVANAVWDGSDAVMLSGETSAGSNPVAAVEAMAEICLAAERSGQWSRGAGLGWL